MEKIMISMADVYFMLSRSRKNIALKNIRRCGIATKPAEVTRIARAAFRHFGVLVVESLTFSKFHDEDHWRSRVKIDIAPDVLAALNDPTQGIILVSGHFGNWEIAAQVLSYMKPVVGITRKMNNPSIERLVDERKPLDRFKLIYKRDATPTRLLSAVKQGDILAILADQYAGDRGMMVDFVGVPASTHTSIALLHLITGVPICFGYCLRTGPMQYELKAGELITHEATGNRKEDTLVILKKINDMLSEVIVKHPEQYLWGHRRWREQNTPNVSSAPQTESPDQDTSRIEARG